MSLSYHYQSFCFSVSSELRIPLLKESSDCSVPDVTVCRGDLSEWTGRESFNNEQTYFNGREDFSYLIQNGNQITVDISGELPLSFFCPRLIDFVARQRGIYALHGVAVCNDDTAVLICGGHGAGKSTLAHEMIRCGWKFLTDDIALIEKDNNIFYIRSGNPVQKLREDTLEHFDCGRFSEFPVIAKGNTEKYYVDVSHSFHEGRLRLGLIVFIDPAGEEVAQKLNGTQKLEALRSCILNTGGVSDTKWNEILCFSVDLSSSVPMLKMGRGELSEEFNLINRFMNRFTVELGGVAIQLEPYSANLCKVFSEYLSSKSYDVEVSLTSDLIEAEAEIRRKYAETRESNFVLSDELSEESAACRAISEKLPEYGTFLLHGSAISYKGEGVVFVASSGTGKSTFSKSWVKRYPEDVRYINDDKPFVRVKNGQVSIFGSPWNGKHHLGSNCSCPLKAICLLERSDTNWAKKALAAEVLPQLLSHLYIPETPVGRAALFSLIQELSHNVSFYRVGCNLDEDASVPCREVLFNHDQPQL